MQIEGLRVEVVEGGPVEAVDGELLVRESAAPEAVRRPRLFDRVQIRGRWFLVVSFEDTAMARDNVSPAKVLSELIWLPEDIWPPREQSAQRVIGFAYEREQWKTVWKPVPKSWWNRLLRPTDEWEEKESQLVPERRWLRCNYCGHAATGEIKIELVGPVTIHRKPPPGARDLRLVIARFFGARAFSWNAACPNCNASDRWDQEDL